MATCSVAIEIGKAKLDLLAFKPEQEQATKNFVLGFVSLPTESVRFTMSMTTFTGC